MKNKLENTLIEICIEHFDKNNNWYNWRKINETKIPQNITLPDGNQYFKNISLKEKLHKKWLIENDLLKKGELIEYYIKTWGGIKGNRKASMDEYRNSNSEQLINKGVKGIASWSKALVLHDWNKYAIFDARVSCSLNAIQIIYSIEEKKTYPILASQNKRIILANKKIKILSKKDNWTLQNENTFYIEYLNLLLVVAKKLETNISTVEMLLFAKAEEFIEKANLN